MTAGAAGFFTFQQSARPERYGESQPLQHDALATGRAGVLVHDRAVNGVLLVEDNTIQRPPQQLIGQLRCSLFSTVEMLAIRLEFLVGAPRFELGTPSPPVRGSRFSDCA